MSTRIVVLTAAVVLGLVVPTSAALLGADQSQPRVDTTTHLEITPSSGPNGQYAEMENGELVLDMDGLSERATTTADDVFTIAVTDERVEAIWIGHDRDGVTFYEGSDRTAAIDESNRREVDEGDAVNVGAAVDTTVAESGTGSFQVHVELADEADGDGGGGYDGGTDDAFRPVQTDFAVAPTTVPVGDPVSVTTTVENRGDRTGTETVELTVDGETVEVREVALAADERETVAFEWTPDRHGTYAVGVGDRSETVTATASDIAAAALALSAEQLEVGETLVATASVENRGNAPGEATTELTVDGELVESREVALAAGERGTVALQWTPDGPGTYEIGVGDHVRTVTVTKPDEPAPELVVTDLALSSDRVTAGETVTATATVENRGSATGTRTVVLTADGESVETADVTLEPGETGTVDFEWTPAEANTYEVGVDEHRLTVAVTEPRSEAVVTDAAIESDRIAPGETLGVTATVENRGNATGTRTVGLSIGGAVVETVRVSLAPGETRTIRFEWRLAEAGTYAVAVDGVDAGSVTVGERSTIVVADRELLSPMLAAVATPLSLGLLFVVSTAKRRRDLWARWRSLRR